MDLDEFLAENGIPVSHEDDHSASLPTTSQTVMQHSPPPTYTTMTTMQPAMAYGQHPTSPTLDLNKRKHFYHPGIPTQMIPTIMMLPGIQLPMSRHELANIDSHQTNLTALQASHKAQAEVLYAHNLSMSGVYQHIQYSLQGGIDQDVPALDQRSHKPKTRYPAPNSKYNSHRSDRDVLHSESTGSHSQYHHVNGNQLRHKTRRPPPLIMKLPPTHLRISDVRSMADAKLPPCELMPRGEIDVKPLVGSLLPRMEQDRPNIPHDTNRHVIEQNEHERPPEKLSSMYVSSTVPPRTLSRSSYYSTEAWSDADSAGPEDLSLSSTSGGHYRQQLSPTPGVSPPPHLTADEVMPKVDVSLDPGAKNDFDPRKRTFTDDELKPQPMMKKSKKVYVPTDLKDDRYWQRRQKNNMAAKRSRDARRVKENQIAMRASFLEKENNVLKQELLKVKEENAYLKKKLTKYEP